MFKIIALFVFAINSAWGSIVTIDGLDIMSRQSEVIIHAGVSRIDTTYDEYGRLITLTTLEVMDSLKGAESQRHITVYQVGGERDGKVFYVSGAHRYRLGEEIFLFGLPLGKENKIVSYGLGVGKFNVTSNPLGDRVVEDLHDVVVSSQETGPGQMSVPKPRTFSTVEEFKRKIIASLKSGSAANSLIIKPVAQDLMWRSR